MRWLEGSIYILTITNFDNVDQELVVFNGIDNKIRSLAHPVAF